MNSRKIVVLCVLLFHSVFVYLGDNASVAGRVIQLLCLIAFIVLFNKRLRIIFYFKNKKLSYAILGYVVAVLITSVLSFFVDTSYLKSLNLEHVKSAYTPSSPVVGIMMAGVILSFFTFIEYLNAIRKTALLCEVFYRLCLFYCIAADISAFSVGVENNMIIGGGKFALSYLHLYLVVFYYLRNSLSHRSVQSRCYYICIIYAAVIAAYSECTTAFVGAFVMFAAFFWKKIVVTKILRKKVILPLLIFCALFPVIFNHIAEIPIVSHIIVDVLGEDLTLTGRTNIYQTLGATLLLRPLWGFGIGNAHWIMAYLYGTANAQNGFANLFLEQGFIGVIAVFALLIVCLDEAKYRLNSNTVFSVSVMIVVFIVMSMVEITIDSMFVVFLSFLLIRNNGITNVNKLGRENKNWR